MECVYIVKETSPEKIRVAVGSQLAYRMVLEALDAYYFTEEEAKVIYKEALEAYESGFPNKEFAFSNFVEVTKCPYLGLM